MRNKISLEMSNCTTRLAIRKVRDTLIDHLFQPGMEKHRDLKDYAFAEVVLNPYLPWPNPHGRECEVRTVSVLMACG